MDLRLKDYRKKASMSQGDLARLLDVDIKTVGNWERGKTMPTCEQLWDCCVILSTDPNSMLGWPCSQQLDKHEEPEIVKLYEGLSAEGREVATNVVAGLADRYPAGDGEDGLVEEKA